MEPATSARTKPGPSAMAWSNECRRHVLPRRTPGPPTRQPRWGGFSLFAESVLPAAAADQCSRGRENIIRELPQRAPLGGVSPTVEERRLRRRHADHTPSDAFPATEYVASLAMVRARKPVSPCPAESFLLSPLNAVQSELCAKIARISPQYLTRPLAFLLPLGALSPSPAILITR